jgi:hypothetical protein
MTPILYVYAFITRHPPSHYRLGLILLDLTENNGVANSLLRSYSSLGSRNLHAIGHLYLVHHTLFLNSCPMPQRTRGRQAKHFAYKHKPNTNCNSSTCDLVVGTGHRHAKIFKFKPLVGVEPLSR